MALKLISRFLVLSTHHVSTKVAMAFINILNRKQNPLLCSLLNDSHLKLELQIVENFDYD